MRTKKVNWPIWVRKARLRHTPEFQSIAPFQKRNNRGSTISTNKFVSYRFAGTDWQSLDLGFTCISRESLISEWSSWSIIKPIVSRIKGETQFRENQESWTKIKVLSVKIEGYECPLARLSRLPVSVEVMSVELRAGLSENLVIPKTEFQNRIRAPLDKFRREKNHGCGTFSSKFWIYLIKQSQDIVAFRNS